MATRPSALRAPWFVLAMVTAALGAACSSEEQKSDEGPPDGNHPGTLVITSPARASMIEGEGGDVEVRGTGATSALTINGAPAEVAPDGKFHATIHPARGLNLVVAKDGDFSLESPFLYGHFASIDEKVAQAISIDIGAIGMNAPAPAASLTSVTNLALADRDLLETLRNKPLSGNIQGIPWAFTMKDGKHGALTVALWAAADGPRADGALAGLSISGTLMIAGLSRDVSISARSAKITGQTKFTVEDGTLHVAMPSSDTKLENLRLDTQNLGFACCVDAVVSTILGPVIESTISNGLKEQLPKTLSLSLDRLGLPKTLDLSMAGVSQPLPFEAGFDGAKFDSFGGTLTAGVKVGGRAYFLAGTPGATARGWLKQGVPFGTPSRSPSLSASLSLDAVNQLLFSAWGTGRLALSLEKPIKIWLSPGLPPVLSVSDSGKLRIGLGEVTVKHGELDDPIAHVSILADIETRDDPDNVVLTASGDPTISITWATEDPGSGNNAIANVVKGLVATYLKNPIKVPLPKLPLDKLGPGFAGQSLVVKDPKVHVDAPSARVNASGTMTLSQ